SGPRRSRRSGWVWGWVSAASCSFGDLGVDRIIMEAQADVVRRACRRGGPEGLAGAVLDQRVPAGQRAVGVMRGEGQREPVKLALAGGATRGTPPLGCTGYGDRLPGGMLAGRFDPAPRARSQLAGQLMQPPALADDVVA